MEGTRIMKLSPSQLTPGRNKENFSPGTAQSEMDSSLGGSSPAISAPPSAGPLDRRKLTPQRMEKYEEKAKPAPKLERRQPAAQSTAAAGAVERNKVLEAQLGVLKAEVQSWKNKCDAGQVKYERMQGRLHGLQETTNALDSHLIKTKQEDTRGKTAEIEVLRSRLVEREQSISNLKSKTAALRDDAQKEKARVHDYKLHLQQKTSQLEEARKLECEATEKNSRMESQVKDLTRQIQRFQNKVGQTEHKMIEFEQLKKDHAALKAEMSQNKEVDEFRKLRFEGKTEQMAAYQTQIDAANNMKSRIESLEQHNDVLRSRMKSHNAVVAKLQEREQELKEAQSQIETIETSSSRLAQQVEGKNVKLEEMNFKLGEAKRIIQNMTREKSELEMKNETLLGKKEIVEGLKDIAETKLLEITKEQLERAMEEGKTDMLPQLYSQVEGLSQQLEAAHKEVHFLKGQLKEKRLEWTLEASNGTLAADVSSREIEDTKLDLQDALSKVQKYRKDKERYKLMAFELGQKYEEKKMYYKTKVESYEQETNQKTRDLQEALKRKDTEMQEALQKKEQEVAARESVVAAKEGTLEVLNDKRSCDGDTSESSPNKMPKAADIAKGKGKGKGKGPPPPKAPPPPRKPAAAAFDGIKLRPLFWGPAQSYGPNSIWSLLMDTECTAEQEEELEQLFLPKPDGVNRSVFERRDSITFLTVLDHSKQQPLAIQFRSIPPPQELVRILEEGDHTYLSPEQVIAVVKEGFVSDDVIMQIKSLQKQHPMTPLGLPEQFFLALSELPEAKDLLRVWRYIANFPIETSSIFKKLRAVRLGADALRECPDFSLMFARLIAAGNRLNAGSVRGSYKGFSMESLIKFCDAKTTDGSNQTLLQVMVKPVSSKFVQSMQRLRDLIDSSCVCMKELETQVLAVEKEAQTVRELVYGEHLTTNWQNCLADAEAVLERTASLVATLNDTKCAVKRVLEYFGVAPDKATDEFFRIWSHFLTYLSSLKASR